MNKIGIITIYDNKNYGNRLQNYAMQTVLEQLDCEVQTIINVPYTDFRYMGCVSFCKSVKRYGKRLIKGKKNSIKQDEEKWRTRSLNNDTDSVRYQSFAQFDKNIHFYHSTIVYYNVKNLKDEFDYFVTGSDQVWNCNIGRGSGIDFLTFARPSQRIAYAASLSLDEIPQKYKNRYRHYLQGMSSISVREEKGKELLLNEFHINSEWVLDPTMMLTKDDWLKVSKISDKLPEKYILCLFLGDESTEAAKRISQLALETNRKIVYLNRKDYPDYYNFGPSEFIGAISSAEYIFTDSFHACVFSILFHKNFYVLKRAGKANNMYSRLEGLFKIMGLHNREFRSDTVIKEINETDWQNVEKNLSIQRQVSEQYLRGALDI